jgi:hypothetical protein
MVGDQNNGGKRGDWNKYSKDRKKEVRSVMLSYRFNMRHRHMLTGTVMSSLETCYIMLSRDM